MTDQLFDQMYPDVLGTISGGVRVNMDSLQCALGIFPKYAYLNQPIEVVLIVQNMVDQPMAIKVSIQLPTSDPQGNPLVLDTPKHVIPVNLGAGEVGVLRTPVLAYPPTPPIADVPVHVAVRYRTQRPGQLVRPPAGGAPPSALNISPYKLQVLRDIEFVAQSWNDSTDIITAHFEIANKRLQPQPHALTPRYETLWTPDEFAQDRELARRKVEQARQISREMTAPHLYPTMLLETEDRFIKRGLPLEPGEVKAVAKIITYTMSESSLDRNFVTEASWWFRTLCHTLAHDSGVATWAPADIAARYLYEAAMYDAVLLGFRIVQPRVRVQLGNPQERLVYANRVISWFGGRGAGDISLIYMPLVLAGIAMNQTIPESIENPWTLISEMRDVFRVRARMAASDVQSVFDMTERLLVKGEDELVRSRIPRP